MDEKSKQTVKWSLSLLGMEGKEEYWPLCINFTGKKYMLTLFEPTFFFSFPWELLWCL